MAPTGNGGKRFIFNTRERALSGDQNRAQDVHDQMLAEILRGLFDASSELDQKAGSVEVFSTGSETPPSATIIAGIRPRPEVGTTNLFVEGGSLVIVDKPAPTTDESKLAFVVDPGVQTAGVLTLTPGSGGSIRIDVIECQRIEPVLESDSRDIFNSSTGLFTPAMVDKVVAARLNYRIRTGTIGGGFPGVAAGWIPLAVCSVPSGATTWDDVTLWDVRPLASERVKQPFNAYPSLNYYERGNIATDITTSSGQVRVRGVADCSFGAYRAGGQLIHPGTTNQYINVADTTLWATALSSANAPWYLYAVFPFGLPRWVQYCPASASIREPRGMRGIPVVARWTPRYDGRPLTNIAQTPSWTGLFDSPTQDAIVVCAGLQGSLGGPYGIVCDGRVTSFVNGAGVAVNSTSNDANSPIGNDWTQWTFTDNVTHAGNARAIYVKFTLRFDITTLGRMNLLDNTIVVGNPYNTFNDTSVVASSYGPALSYYIDTTGTFYVDLVQRIPLPIDQAYASARAFKVRWNHNISGSADWTITARTAKVTGWELGP